jgi:hypothetical protein
MSSFPTNWRAFSTKASVTRRKASTSYDGGLVNPALLRAC